MVIISSIGSISWPSSTARSDNLDLPSGQITIFSIVLSFEILVCPSYVKFVAVCACQFTNSLSVVTDKLSNHAFKESHEGRSDPVCRYILLPSVNA